MRRVALLLLFTTSIHGDVQIALRNTRLVDRERGRDGGGIRVLLDPRDPRYATVVTGNITVTLIPDEDGYVGRECPPCQRYFKTGGGT